MANKLITNIFDSALQTYVDDSKKYEAGNETCFTNNKIIAAVKSQVAAMVPEAELKTSATVSEWTNVFCFEMEYRLTYKNIYSHMRGFYIRLAKEHGLYLKRRPYGMGAFLVYRLVMPVTDSAVKNSKFVESNLKYDNNYVCGYSAYKVYTDETIQEVVAAVKRTAEREMKRANKEIIDALKVL